MPIKIPIYYPDATVQQRREARQAHADAQHGLCYYCAQPLTGVPPPDIRAIKINWDLFPPGFLDYPQHLHHDHDTGITLGTVHAWCNAVLWQEHGE
ncbi:hypothetical protein [Sinimarinibacterium sp. NLF-5-8]|uniref:hypothetical protein n=1 Tax=Sinimarinibacterium sp. NLF-5-8 TaxID=2698684 RepID=UPI00137BDEDC|nr:hypothetical protein [Sinimarinibacterium sp. NLF-5-8]QHS09003.1 hypothetical protein GT972_01830 [Sinimarinibacterium sp. NLF-5-8]